MDALKSPSVAHTRCIQGGGEGQSAQLRSGDRQSSGIFQSTVRKQVTVAWSRRQHAVQTPAVHSPSFSLTLLHHTSTLSIVEQSSEITAKTPSFPPPPPPLWLPETTFCFYASLKVSFTAALPPAIKYLYEKPHGFAAAGWCSAGNLGEPDLNSNEIAGTHEIPGLFPPILQPAAVLPGASPASHPHPHSPGAQQVLSVLTSRALWGEKAG